MKSEQRMLLVIDPQIDFISGSLPVGGAAAAMDALSRHILSHCGEYALTGVSLDWHPANHISFVEQGGKWPRHCVRYSEGAAIWPALYNSMINCGSAPSIFLKGTEEDREEYSVFQNPEAAAEIKSLVERHSITAVDICGLAGDICVLASLTDGLNALDGCRFRVLGRYSPTISTDNTLQSFCRTNGIEFSLI